MTLFLENDCLICRSVSKKSGKLADLNQPGNFAHCFSRLYGVWKIDRRQIAFRAHEYSFH